MIVIDHRSGEVASRVEVEPIAELSPADARQARITIESRGLLKEKLLFYSPTVASKKLLFSDMFRSLRAFFKSGECSEICERRRGYLLDMLEHGKVNAHRSIEDIRADITDECSLVMVLGEREPAIYFMGRCFFLVEEERADSNHSVRFLPFVDAEDGKVRYDRDFCAQLPQCGIKFVNPTASRWRKMVALQTMAFYLVLRRELPKTDKEEVLKLAAKMVYKWVAFDMERTSKRYETVCPDLTSNAEYKFYQRVHLAAVERMER